MGLLSKHRVYKLAQDVISSGNRLELCNSFTNEINKAIEENKEENMREAWNAMDIYYQKQGNFCTNRPNFYEWYKEFNK